MKVLVTGAAGFLGSHLVDALIARGHEVVGVDNMLTGNERNLEHLKTEKLWKGLIKDDIVSLDLGRINSLKSLYHPIWEWNDQKIDVIYNFACPASPPAYQDNPVHTMMTCVVGTKNMLDLAVKNKAIFVQASTSEVYGDPDVSPQHESYKGCVNTTGPRACYDEGKRAAEALCFDYFRDYNLGGMKVVRIFNTYGPRMDPNDGRVVTNFLHQALKGHKLTVYGDGSQTRSFCYVDDLIRGFVKVLDTPKEFTGPMNLGNPNEFTMNHLAAEVLHTIYGGRNDGRSVHSWIKTMPLPQDDPKQRRPDISLAREVLGWEPQVQLTEGLQRTVEYLKKTLDRRGV